MDCMTAYIPVGDHVTAVWLTAVLREAGILRQGEVTAVENEATRAFNSHTSHLLLSYSADASPAVPTRLVTYKKRNHTSD